MPFSTRSRSEPSISARSPNEEFAKPIPQPSLFRRRLFQAVLMLAGMGLSVPALQWLTDPAPVALEDFVEYWAAGRLNAEGANPYDFDQLFHTEKEVSPELNDVIRMWNPPWTLTVVMPFGLLPPRVGHVLWLALHLGVAWGCADWLWRLYGGPVPYRWVAWLVTAGFVPLFLVLQMGQISLLVLLGVVGFLHWEKRGQYFWAGVVVALAAIKPQIVYLFAAAILLWTFQQRRWSILVGGWLALLALLALPLACNPQVFPQYLHAMRNQTPEMLCPTIGSLLRLGLGREKLWLQFIPMLAGLGWLVVYWFRRRHHWVWADQVPVILPVSLVTASYGAWQFDMVVLLPLVIQATVWVFQNRHQGMLGFGLTALVGFDLLALMLRNVRWSEQYWHVWMAPMLLFGYLALRRERKAEPPASPLLADA